MRPRPFNRSFRSIEVPPMGQQWFYEHDGKEHGPVSGSELKKLSAMGVLKATDLVWERDHTDRIPASGVEGLFPLTAITATPNSSQHSGRAGEKPTAISFSCPSCSMKLQATNEEIGSNVTCPRCNVNIEVPLHASTKGMRKRPPPPAVLSVVEEDPRQSPPGVSGLTCWTLLHPANRHLPPYKE